MIIKLLCAFIFALMISLGFGRKLVPWLKRHGFIQPLKDEVRKNVYTGAEQGSDSDS